MASTYSFDDLLGAYRSLLVPKGAVLFVTSDLARLWAYENPDKTATLEAHVRVLEQVIGPEGTLVVPTGSVHLCNTNTPFDLEQTPSHRLGVLSEFVRTLPGVNRSFHPFVSFAAKGPKAEAITANTSRHAFGPESPMARMLDLDAICISIGLYPRWTCTTIHHVEHMMAAPYRYTKEFIHPVIRNGRMVSEPFYMNVRYMDSDVERSANRHIFERLEKTDLLQQTPVGEGHIWAYSMRAFAEIVTQLMVEDPYIWCEIPPAIRPWQE